MTRLCKPPRFRMTLSTIQVVALPQMTRRMSLRSDAHPFQNDSNAQRNPDLGVSYHGSSSRKTTFLPAGNPSSNDSNSENAHIQEVNLGHDGRPCRRSASRKLASVSRRDAPSSPAWWKANFPLKNSLTRNVLPTLRRP